MAAVASTEMGSRAGPTKSLGRFDQTGTDGVQLDIANGVPKVAFFHGARVETVLPEVPATDPACVMLLSVAAVSSA